MSSPTRLNSDQESTIEELIQSSFGAQFLYLPIKYKRNGNEKEQCDLIWFGNGILVLFYLTTGNASLKKQDEHNLKQARKWNRYWKTKSDLTLDGKNRYGEEIKISKDEIKYTINISLVGHKTGIIFHECDVTGDKGFTCTIPEMLIHEISKFHGTIIDLLKIIQIYSLQFQRHITRHSASAEDRLKFIIRKQINQIKSAIERNKAPGDNESDDLSFIYSIIEKFRLSDPYGQDISGGNGPRPREKIAAYFSDLSATDYAIIAVTAKAIIQKTEGGKLSCTGKTNGLHTNWVIFASEIGSIKNFDKVLEESKKAISNMCADQLPQIVYGNPRDIFDYRTPAMFTLPRGRILSQAEDLVNLIMVRLAKIIPTRKIRKNNQKNFFRYVKPITFETTFLF